MSRVFVVGTGDTKHAELEYIANVIRAAGTEAIFVDVGTTGHVSTADVTPDDVAAHHPDGADGGPVVRPGRSGRGDVGGADEIRGRTRRTSSPASSARAAREVPRSSRLPCGPSPSGSRS